MKETKLFKLYNILDKQEKKALKLWLSNRGYNEELIYLNECLLKYSTQAKKMERALKKMDSKKLGNLRFQLFTIVEDFLLVNWLLKKAGNNKSNHIQKKILQLEYYQSKELPNNSEHIGDLSKIVDFKLKEIKSELDKTTEYNSDFYLYKFMLNIHFYHGLNTSMWQEGKYYLNRILLNLDTFYTLTKMRYSNEALFRSKMVNEQFEFPDLFWLQSKVSFLTENYKKEPTENPLLQLYYQCIQLSLNINKENLLALTDTIIEKANLLNAEEMGIILMVAINYTSFISRTPKGNKLVKINYKLHKTGFEKFAFLTNGLLQPQILINFAYLCSEVNEPEEIIPTWGKYNFRIEHDFKNSTLYLCKAYEAFAKKEFTKAIEYTTKESKREMRFFLSKKLLQIKSYFELKDYTILEEERNNLMKYIRNNEEAFNENLYDALFNFTQIIRELNKPNSTKDMLLKMLNRHNFQTVERHWLLNKINKK